MSPVGQNVEIFLKMIGHSDADISKFNSQTSLNLDIGLNGDNFFDALDVLRSHFDVDLGDFNWTKYVYSQGELISDHMIYRIIYYFVGDRAIRYSIEGVDPFRKLEPVTLAMIEDAIVQKSWQT
ncbi:MAG: hypothetical protein ACRCUE_01280 [Bosea sp. (in: a-proteobacteria)]